MRQPEPWYRTSKAAWYVQVANKKIHLAKGPKDETRKAAFDAFYKLVAAQPGNVPAADKLAVAVLCDLFLDHSHPSFSRVRKATSGSPGRGPPPPPRGRYSSRCLE